MMKRRTFIKHSIVSTVALGTVGCTAGDMDQEMLTIEGVIKKIDQMSKQTITSTGEWSPAKVFRHCAQSIEYSFSGFPEHKSEFFKNTVGKLAIWVFSSRGQMSHGLNEPIPGAAPLEEEGDTKQALEHLKQAFIRFQKHQGKLEPHFAYGSLQKEEYAVAHILHLYNHLEEMNLS